MRSIRKGATNLAQGQDQGHGRDPGRGLDPGHQRNEDGIACFICH